MTIVTKNGYRMGVNNDVQLDAFLQSGWKIAEGKKPAPIERPKKQVNVADKPATKKSVKQKKEQ